MDRCIPHLLKHEVLDSPCLDVVLQDHHAQNSSKVSQGAKGVSIGALSTTLSTYTYLRGVERTGERPMSIFARRTQTQKHAAGS